MQVLIYGEWGNQSKNIKSFFTATYSEAEKKSLPSKILETPIRFVFVGSLVLGKNPLYAIQLVECFLKKNTMLTLDLYGEGNQRELLEKYIIDNQLEKNIFLKGNQSKEVLKEAYQQSHFVILASKSEGWPKAVAEGMFWGCVPLASAVSCVPDMLDYGKRGVILQMNLEKDSIKLETLFQDQLTYESFSKSASDWSRQYTTEVFGMEIEKLLKK